MGTNFYMMTKNEELAVKYAGWNYTLTDKPDWGYQIHLAKTSCGWLPLFQGYKDGIQSVKDMKAAYDTSEFFIYDEYGNIYNWEQFDERVLQFNGGRLGVQKPKKIEKPEGDSVIYDKAIPEYGPFSHIPGSKQSYEYNAYGYICEELNYFIDDEGYEFSERIFS